MSFSLPCVLFAGGRSSRMGRDKALLPFREYATLTEYQYRRLLPLFQNVFISAKEKKFPFDAPMIADRAEIFAPTSGLLAAFQYLKKDFFALAVDTPFVDEVIIEKLVETYERGDAEGVVARSPGGFHPMCGIYTTRLGERLKSMVETGSHRLGYLLRNADTHFVDFDDDAPFFNMNTPREYETAQKR
jgi:molybdopterin-guanine dinucleotide biosynthesis protein A